MQGQGTESMDTFAQVAAFTAFLMGLGCILFPSRAATVLSLYLQLLERTNLRRMDPEQSWARPFFIRLMGATLWFMAGLVYLSVR
jgi:hypothetical protein